MKRCQRCGETKAIDAFTRHRKWRDGLKPWCKACCAAHERNRRVRSPDHIRALDQQRRARDPVRRKQVERRASAKQWTNKPDEMRARQRVWERSNRGKTAAWNAIKRARRRQATPAWLTQSDKALIVALYERAAAVTKQTGVVHHVDHIEPLASPDVCGLHVPWNLRVLPAVVNMKKGNRRGG